LLSDGTVVAERHAPKDSFDGHQMSTPWDPLDRHTSTEKAVWTYLTMPFLPAKWRVCEWGKQNPGGKEERHGAYGPETSVHDWATRLKPLAAPLAVPWSDCSPGRRKRGAGIAQRVSWGILARFIPLQQVRFTSRQWHRPASQPSRLLWHTYFPGSIETQPHTGLFLRRERLHAPPP
jgi:hypothetical protein